MFDSVGFEQKRLKLNKLGKCLKFLPKVKK